MTKPLIIDFETHPIDNVPDGRVPMPVGLAIDGPGMKAPRYLAWGHPTGNNTSSTQACDLLRKLADKADTLVCHNIGFDTEVARQWLCINLDSLKWHDTQIMAFHENPHALQLGLKPLAKKYADMPPDEMDEVRDWLIEHKHMRRSQKDIGPYIYLAPGDLVGKYAIGDVVRTRRLFELWWPKYRTSERWRAYERDVEATKVGIAMQRRGVPLDRKTIDSDLNRAEEVRAKAVKAVSKELRADYDPNQREALADAIEARYGVRLPATATGRRQTNKEALDAILPDGKAKALTRYVGAIDYDLKNYLRPWQAAIAKTGGRIHPHWSVTRTDDGGARTGRLSSSPNFQNLRGEEGTATLVERLARTFKGWDYWTPQIRGCVQASKGAQLVGRDWSQIELRLTAHYEDGPMAANYRDNPDWDLHQWVMDRVWEMFHAKLPRRIAKNIGFGSIYGAGAGAIARQAGISLEEAAEFRRMYFAVLSSLRRLMNDVQAAARQRPIRTIGGRLYTVEPARFDPGTGEMRTFEYKMLNYLIQGSAADLMKEAMIEAHRAGLDLILSVHDEPVVECDAGVVVRDEALATLRRCMDENALAKQISVPVISNGYAVRRWSDADAAKGRFKGK